MYWPQRSVHVIYCLVCNGEFLWKSLSLQHNFVTATSHTNSVWFDFLKLVAATKFCCRDKDFPKNAPTSHQTCRQRSELAVTMTYCCDFLPCVPTLNHMLSMFCFVFFFQLGVHVRAWVRGRPGQGWNQGWSPCTAFSQSLSVNSLRWHIRGERAGTFGPGDPKRFGHTEKWGLVTRQGGGKAIAFYIPVTIVR